MKKKLLLISLVILSFCLFDIQNLFAQDITSLPDLIPYRKGDKWGFCNQKKEIKINCIYDDVSFFKDDLSVACLNQKFGFIDKNGKVVISLKYDNARSFEEGLALVQLDGKWGCIDKDGKEIIPLIYSYILCLSRYTIEFSYIGIF